MASKKKVSMPDDLKTEKEKMVSDVQAVGKAAKGLMRIPISLDAEHGVAWGDTQKQVEQLDQEFSAMENKLSNLQQEFEHGAVDIRVLQVGPGGKLTDVSNKVNPKDLRAEQISEIVSEGQINTNLRSKEAALRLLSEILPGFRPGTTTTSDSIRRMEWALADSDKILEHWKH